MSTAVHDLINIFPTKSVDSKVWIYQANRMMTKEEVALLKKESASFVSTWESHGSKLNAEVVLLYNLFIIFSVDEQLHEASGCSIDKSVNFIKELQNTLQIDFFDRTLVAFLEAEDSTQLRPLAQVKSALIAGKINNKSLIFNNIITNIKQLRTEWIIPIEESWVSKFL